MQRSSACNVDVGVVMVSFTLHGQSGMPPLINTKHAVALDFRKCGVIANLSRVLRFRRIFALVNEGLQ